MRLHSNHELYSEVLQEAQREQHFNTLHWNSLLCQRLVSYCHQKTKKMHKKYLHSEIN